MYCNHCGKENHKDAEKCSSCGADLTENSKSGSEKEDPSKYKADSDYALPVLGWLSNILIVIFLPILHISDLTFNISTIVLGLVGVIFGAMHLRYKKIHGFIIIIVSIAVATSVSLSSFGESGPEDSNSGQSEETQGGPPGQDNNQAINQKDQSDEEDKVYKIGETVTIGNFMGESIDMTINDASLSKSEAALKNDQVLTLDITAENTGDGTLTVSEDDFTVYDSDDSEAENYQSDDSESLESDLDSGSQLDEKVRFDVNESESYKIVYQPFESIDDKKVAFQYNID